MDPRAFQKFEFSLPVSVTIDEWTTYEDPEMDLTEAKAVIAAIMKK